MGYNMKPSTILIFTAALAGACMSCGLYVLATSKTRKQQCTARRTIRNGIVLGAAALTMLYVTKLVAEVGSVVVDQIHQNGQFANEHVIK